MNSGVYQIKNRVNDMIYVGSSRNLKQRENKHWMHFRHNRHPNRYLSRAVNKYGIDNFSFEVVEYCEPELLKEKEQAYMDEIRAFGDGYNLLPRAYRNKGYKHTKEALEKMSQAMRGKKFSEEHKRNISEALKGKKRSEEHSKAISLAKKGKPSGFKGKKLPDSAKEKLRQYQLNNPKVRNDKGQFCGDN